MQKKRRNRLLALCMAFVMTIGSSNFVYASELQSDIGAAGQSETVMIDNQQKYDFANEPELITEKESISEDIKEFTEGRNNTGIEEKLDENAENNEDMVNEDITELPEETQEGIISVIDELEGSCDVDVFEEENSDVIFDEEIVDIEKLEIAGTSAYTYPSDMFPQQTPQNCLRTAIMYMLRVKAYRDGNNHWDYWKAKEKDHEKNNVYSYYAATSYVDKEGYGMNMTVSTKDASTPRSTSAYSLSVLKGLLDDHPEGIVYYYQVSSSARHAVLLTRYEGDTLYCYDPAKDFSGKERTVASSDLKVKAGKTTQSGIINNSAAKISIWYISKSSNKPSPAVPQYAAPTITSSSISNIDYTNGTYQITANIYAEAGLNRVQFPTWTEKNGQDDLASNWVTNSSYSGKIESLGNNNYRATYTVYKSAHNNEYGIYRTHVYAYDNQGRRVVYAHNNIELKKPPVITSVKVDRVYYETGTYRVMVYVDNYDEIDRVQFPTWTEKNGQDDLFSNWQTNEACSGFISGTFISYTVKISDHNNERGNYITHVYVYGKNGTRTAYAVPKVNMDKPSEGAYGNISWSLNAEGTLTIEGTGAVDEQIYKDRYPWLSQITKVKKVVFGEGITSIGRDVLGRAVNLTDIEFPSTLKEIGANAFGDCTSLSGTIVLPPSIQDISYGAFYGTNINKVIFTSATIPRFVAANLAQKSIASGTGRLSDSSIEATYNAPENSYSYLTIDIKNNIPNNINGTIVYTWSVLVSGPGASFPKNAILSCPPNWATEGLLSLHKDYDEANKTLGEYACELQTSLPTTDLLGNRNDVAPISVSLNTSQLSLEMGQTSEELKATVFPENATDKTVQWYSSDESVATVDTNGRVSAKAVGKAEIYACIGGTTIEDYNTSQVAVCTITVYDSSLNNELEVELLADSLSMNQGETRALAFITTGGDGHVVFSSDDARIVSIDRDGVLSAVSIGETYVHLLYESKGEKIDKKCLVEVISKAQSVQLNKTDLQLIQGDKEQLFATVYPMSAKGTVVEWSSGNDEVVTVDENGKLLATGIGETNVIAKLENDEGINASCHIVVSNAQNFSVDLEEAKSVLNTSEDSEVISGIWVSGLKDKTYTGNKLTQDIRVYDGYRLLTEKKDYTVSYKNNINAADKNSAKAPALILTMKGNYTGKVTIPFTIYRADIGEDNLSISVEDLLLASNNRAQYGVPTIYYGNKKLKNKTDFDLQYLSRGDGAYVVNGTYKVKIVGKNNYQGERTITQTITTKKFLSKATIEKIEDIPYTGDIVKIIPTISYKGFPGNLVKGTDFDVEYEGDLVNIGTVKATIVALDEGEFVGKKTFSYKIIGPSINKATVKNLPASVVYTGDPVTISGYELYDGITKLKEKEDYTVSYDKNETCGTASIIFTGKNKYTGSLKKTFKITAHNIADEDVYIDNIGTVAYEKNGAMPIPIISFNGKTLQNKVDYTLSYSNNKNITTEDKPALVTITGKGKFSGKKIIPFQISEQDISKLSIVIDDQKYTTKKNGYIKKPVIRDKNGKALQRGTDYTLEYKPCRLDEKDVPAVNSYVEVTATGTGKYSGKISTTYRIFNINISSAKVSVTAQNYSGTNTILSDNVNVTYNTIPLTLGEEYIVSGYMNNSSAGTATVILKGVGEYGGTKTVKFSIKKKAIIPNFIGAF